MNCWWYERIVKERLPQRIKSSFGVQKRGLQILSSQSPQQARDIGFADADCMA